MECIYLCKELELKGTEGNHNKAEIRNGDIAELLEGKGRKHQNPNKKREKHVTVMFGRTIIRGYINQIA